MALEIITTDTVTDDDVLNLDRPFFLATAVVDGTTYLIVTGSDDNGLSVFAVGVDGKLTNVDNVSDAGSLQLAQPTGVATAAIGDVTYVFVTSVDDLVSVFALEADGTLVFIDKAGTSLIPFGPATATFGDTTYLFVADPQNSQILSFHVASNGMLTSVETETLPTTGSFAPLALETIVVNGITYILTSGEDAYVYEVASDGTLSYVGVGGRASYGHGTAEVDHSTYLFMGIDRVSVYSVADDGTLSLVDEVDSGVAGHAFTVQIVDGVPYLFTFGADGGVLAFSIGDDGTLTEAGVANGRDTGSQYEKVVSAVVGGVPYLFSTAPEDGVDVYRLQHNIIDEAAMAVAVAENGTAVTTVAKLYAEDDVGYSLGGADGALFTIDPDGNLAFIVAPDFEAPEDADGDNTYEVAVTADDGIISETKLLTVAVTDVNDIAPTITSDGGGATAGVAVAENTTMVTTVAATDPEGAPTYAIVGGVDAALFAIDTITGALRFLAAPDFEAPTDTDADNVYDVVVAASDGVQQDIQALSVAVTDVDGLILNGTKAGETLTGGGEEDTILGRNGKDVLEGLAGNDTLDGGRKKDKLTGGADSDGFRFSSQLKNKWVDKITDFEVGTDMILLDKAVFKKAGPKGALKEKYFDTGKVADSGKDRVLFDEKTNTVRYDADGVGGKDAVKVFKVTNGPALSADDFMLV